MRQGLYTLITIAVSIFIYDRYRTNHTTVVYQPDYYHEMRQEPDQGLSSPIFDQQKNANFVEVADRAMASVVYITSYEKVNHLRFKEEYRLGKGSGIIISDDGDIVTNYHVVKDADDIKITLEDKREYMAEVIGSDVATDLAVLKIEANQLPFQTFSNSDSLNVGEWILAIGNPFGLQSTVTAGIVSAKARNIDIHDNNDIESFIQTDAVINPGSSGGALVNDQGKLMGIYTAILSKSGNYEGLSFAIPSNLAKKVVIDIKEYGAVQRAKIGISITDVDAQLADQLNLSFIAGVAISSINLNSAAASAGFRKNDVIMNVNGQKIHSSSEFYEALNRYRPGDVINIVYHRNSKDYATNITLRNYLNTTDYITVRNDKILRDLGIEIRDLSSKEKSRVKSKGVMIVSVTKGSTIDQTNMEPGFIVEYFNDTKIESSRDFIRLIKNSKDKITLKGFYERYPDVYPYTFHMNH